jgi:CheY-like chemotaxis protein
MSEIQTLIVDDSSVMRKIVERALRQAGLDSMHVYEAGNGSEGLDVLRASKNEITCRLPCSVTGKASLANPVTGLPDESITITSTRTALAVILRLEPGGTFSDAGCCPSANTPTNRNQTSPEFIETRRILAPQGEP